MSHVVPQVFFAYPYKPDLRRETVVQAARVLNEAGDIRALPWEDLSVGGRLIIRQIVDAIDTSQSAVFDVTDLNENVLFELGLAIGRNKPVWLIKDSSFAAASKRWGRFALLEAVGHARYQNSEDIVKRFRIDRPGDAPKTIYEQLIHGGLGTSATTSVLLLASPHETNAANAILRTLEREQSSTFTLLVDDPRESAVQPLAWYAAAIAQSRGVVIHFSSPDRQNSDIHNARAAFLGGLARGLNKAVLLLAEEDYSTPIDYQDTLFVYSAPREAAGRVTAWLAQHKATLVDTIDEPSPSQQRALTLRSLRLGNFVAENEASTLAEYFVETRSYVDVLEGGVGLFVGRKGAGKSANLIRAADELAEDPRNVVCVIKPAGYEVDGLLRLLRNYREKDSKGYLLESFWKFLLFSELAKAAVEQLKAKRRFFTPGSPEADLVDAVDQESGLIGPEFAVRLERAVSDLLPIDVESGIAAGRLAISEALHDTTIRQLSDLLARALSGRQRIAILIDNLDKAWEEEADLGELSQLLLGLLGAMRPFAAAFSKRDRDREPIATSLAVFMRSDIFWHVSRHAREPDKLAVSYLDWSDQDLLSRVLEERYAAARDTEGRRIWDELFVAKVESQTARDWLLGAILPRPRDLVYLANASITNAVNRGHDVVEADDLQDAREVYSRYAVESILVEGAQEIERLEEILFQFASAPAAISEEDALARIRAGLGKKPRLKERVVLQHLLELSFLGVETRPGVATFADDRYDLERALAIGKARANRASVPMSYVVHPAFTRYFEVEPL